MKGNNRSFKSIIAITLVLSIIITCGSNTVIAKADDNNPVITRLTTGEKQGVILHAWDWSFNNVTANLDAIKTAGYTEIQVSPIQVNKDLNDEYTTSDKWWILYQPAGFQIGNKQLGTEDEFKAMCAAAKAKGIKIIVDTIVNHMGNNGDPDIPAEEVADLDPDLSLANHPEMWHVDSNGKLNVISDYNDRYDVTHNGVGLPDLNTANPILQEKIHAYLQKCLDDGAAGFRFDTAKHVELPIDADGIKSDFWPNVLTGLHTTDGNTPFVYGEVLQGGADNIAGYAEYFNTTASNYGSDIRSTVGVGTSGPNLSGNIDKLKSYDVPSSIDPSELVTWVESHDTYANDSSESTAMTDEQIKNGWAIVASRANSTPLFFNRPAGRKKLQGNIGDVGSDTWKDPDVVAINKFHTAMDGQDESLIKLSDNILMIERGTSSDASKKGVVIVNLTSTPYQLAAGQAINLDDGIYTNCAPIGGTFDVTNGQISGTVPSGITVLYAGGIQEQPVITPKVSIDKEDCSFDDKLDLTLHVTSAASATYSIDGAPQGSYADGQTITIGESAAFGATIKVVVSATSSDGKTASETYTYIKRDPNAKTVVYFTKPDGWQIPYAYVYNDLKENYNNEAWPGTKMVKIGENLYKLEITGFTNGQVIFNDWFYGSHQTSAFSIAPSDSVEKKLYDTDGTWKDTTATFDNGTTLPDDGVTNGTAKVYFQKPSTADWNYDDVNIYFYGKGGPSWPGVPMTKVEGSTNLYTYTLPAGLEGSNVIFNVNGGSAQVPGHNESGFTAPANSSMIYADGVWKEYVEAGTSRIYFRKPSDWGEPKVYAYPIDGDTESKVSVDLNTWPGVAMEKVSGTDTLYSYTFSSDSQNMNIIFTDGTNQYPSSGGYQLLVGESKIYDNGALRDFTTDDLEEPATTESSQGVTKVYFKNTFGWDKVKVYAYNDGTSDKVKDWPGESAVDEGNGLYSYTLPKGFESATVIFNNDGNGKQTDNLQTTVGSTMEFVSDGTESNGKLNGKLVSKSKVYFKNTLGWDSVKIHYWEDGGSSTVWPGESMVYEGDNLYSYVMPDGYENANVIFNNNNKGKQTATVKSESEKTLILDGDNWREFTTNDIPGSGTGTTPEEPANSGDTVEVGSTVYVKVPSGWNGIPNIHYWNTAGESTTWPGVAMKDEGNGIYSATIPKSFADVSIIINDGSNKLADKDGNTEFAVKLGSTIIFEDGAWKDYVKPTPDPVIQEVSKTPTVDGIIYTTTTTAKGTAGANADIVLSVDDVTTSAAVQYTNTTTSAGAQYVIGTSKADENGNWSVQIPTQRKGTVIKITAKEEGKSEVSITVTVKKKSATNSGSSSSSHRKEETVTVDGNSTIIKSSDVSVIKDSILNANTSNIVVKLSSSQSVAMKSIFEALLSKPDKTLTLVQGDVSLTFKGTDLLANGAADLDTTIQSISSNASAINNLTNGAEIINLSFAYKGAFPGKATITEDINSKYNNKLMYVYSYNATNNRLTLISLNVPVQNGEVSFTASKGSDYILSETPITGAVTEGWNKTTDGNWIYVKDENNVTGWIYDGGNWYLTNESGIMQKGWNKDRNGKWYYLNSSGAMQTGWLNDNGTWYYLSPSGDMLSDTTIDGYTLGVDGAWIA
ncbi:starch-binding protein [Clostridium sp.]|uniref:starch-binding protein n=1 Tax=Clostridium sp. TaxID=1506 RepID=UPI0026037616|nr:starch-binding protein [Clostridium sp.]